jgi:hypothetical protein
MSYTAPKPYLIEKFYTVSEMAQELRVSANVIKGRALSMNIKGSFRAYGVLYFNEQMYKRLTGKYSFEQDSSDVENYEIIESKINNL